MSKKIHKAEKTNYAIGRAEEKLNEALYYAKQEGNDAVYKSLVELKYELSSIRIHHTKYVKQLKGESV